MIKELRHSAISFKGATVNINAISDTHGMLENCAAAYEVIKNNSSDAFISEGKGKRNLFMVAGDWFMAGDTEGYLSRQNAVAQDFQLEFFNEFTKKLKTFARDLRTFFTIGNHDLDCGADKLNESISKMDAITVSSNVDLEKSSGCRENILSGKLKNSYIMHIEDDGPEFKDGKKNDLTHQVLVLGLSPVNMSFYNKKADYGKSITFADDTMLCQDDLGEAQYEKTFEALETQIKEFKNNYPKGVVVLMSHVGTKPTEIFLKRNKDIDLVLSGHDHLDSTHDIDDNPKRKFVNLSQNFGKVENIKIRIDDDGNIKDMETKPLSTEGITGKGNDMWQYFKETFACDLVERYPISSDGLEYLDVKEVRNENNHLANYVNDVILSEIQKTAPDVKIFGLNASAYRSGLPTNSLRGANNLELMLVLNGLKEYSADIFVNEISGKELIEIIHQNLKFNQDGAQKVDPGEENRKPLMQYSGLLIDKHLKDFDTEKTPIEDLRQFVRLEETGEPVELETKYKVANVFKWLLKSEYTDIKRLRDEAVKLGNTNAKRLFREYFERLSCGKVENPLVARKKERIIDSSSPI